MITIGSLFDGIGGFPLAAQRNGMKAIWASEIEPFPIKVTKIRFPDMKHLGDITKINGAEIEPVDIITGGSPCQDLSVAGKRAGMKHTGKGDEETTRSGLFMEQVRIVREMRKNEKRNGRTGVDIRPRFMVWENVPGAFSSNKGEDFRAVLEETARIADETAVIPGPQKGKWNTAGCIMGNSWSIAWRILDAQYWGVPQRRRRIYLVADFGGQSAPEVLFKSEGLSRYLAEGGKTRKRVTADVERSTTTAGGNTVTSTLFAAYGTKWNGNSGAVTGDHFVMDNAERGVDGAKQYLFENHSQDTRYVGPLEVSPIVSATFGMGGNNQPFVVNETYSIQGSMIGRADKNGPQGDGINEDVSFTLNATDHPPAIVERSTPKTMLVRCGCRGGGKGPLIQDNKSATLSCANIQTLFEPIAIDSNCQDSRFKLTGDIVPRVTDYTVVAVHQNASGEVRQNKVANTLNTNSDASGRNAPLIAGTVSSKWAKGTGGPAGDECQNLVCRPLRAQSQHSHREDLDNVIFQQYSVRRLTPLECERLQDFPDGWTDIPGGSDSARYKALGNSIAVCCAEYVLEGIKEAINQ